MKLLVLAFTSKTYHSEPAHTGTEPVISDRADLTRKLPCMDTWVSRMKNIGHEVIFFDGDNKQESFDKKNQLLHLTASDSYDYYNLLTNGKSSNMAVKLQHAMKWALKNREFDFILRVDDGTYVNAFVIDEFLNKINNVDLAWSAHGGGGGIFFSRKACEEFVKETKYTSYLEDIVIFDSFTNKNEFQKRGYPREMSSFYVLLENLVTIHYATGKRMYYCDFIISNYHLGITTSRKVIFNYSLNPAESLNTNRVDSKTTNTPLWYGLDRDRYGWEYYGNYSRSIFDLSEKSFSLGNNTFEILYIFDIEINHITTEALFNILRSIKPNGKLRFVFTPVSNVKLISNTVNFLKSNNLVFDVTKKITFSTIEKTEYIKKELKVALIDIKL